MPILYIFASVLLVSAASFAGAFSISISPGRLRQILIFLIPLAIGALLGDAFFHLIPQAFEETENPAAISFLVLLGIFSVFLLEKFLRWHHHSAMENSSDHAPHAPHKEDPKYLGQIILFSDGLHNFIDGIVIGVSYLASVEIGIATTLAVILHEIPQEIGDFGVLIYSGYKRATALLYNFLSALTAVAGATLVIILGSFPERLVEGVLPFAAGIFIYIASSDLVPELHKHEKGKNVFFEIAGLAVGILAMYLLLFLE